MTSVRGCDFGQVIDSVPRNAVVARNGKGVLEQIRALGWSLRQEAQNI